jgi:MFS family permease
MAKPMLAFFTYPIWIFFVRTIERFGKGIRTGARDAILSDEATPATKGRVFGFHRSMDTFGAVLGPFIALLYLYFYPGNYITLFYIAFLPGLFAIGASLFLKDKQNTPGKSKHATSFLSFLNYWKTATPNYRKLVTGLLIFALVNSSDMFLLLHAKQSGISDTYVIGLYIFYNLIFSLFALPLGILADKIGLKSIFIFGLILFAIVYAGMSVPQNLSWFIGLFFLYGIYASATDGIAKAWISTISDKKDTATAIGTYAGFQSICAMLSSSLTGLIWFQFGSSIAFTITAVSTLLLAIYFIRLPQPNRTDMADA